MSLHGQQRAILPDFQGYHLSDHLGVVVPV